MLTGMLISTIFYYVYRSLQELKIEQKKLEEAKREAEQLNDTTDMKPEDAVSTTTPLYCHLLNGIMNCRLFSMSVQQLAIEGCCGRHSAVGFHVSNIVQLFSFSFGFFQFLLLNFQFTKGWTGKYKLCFFSTCQCELLDFGLILGSSITNFIIYYITDPFLN